MINPWIHKAVFLAYITQTLCKNKALDFEQYLKRQKLAFATKKIQVQPVVKVAAGSKIRKPML
jgi:hypothetical protein